MAYNIDMTLKELMASPEVMTIMNGVYPGFSKNPKLAFVKNKSLRDVAKIPIAKITPEMLAKVEEELSKLP